jgi:hypothetical protein
MPGTASSKPRPKCVDSLSNAKPAPRREIFAFGESCGASGSGLSGAAFPFAAGTAGDWKDRMPACCLRVNKNVGVRSVSWHMNVQRFLTIFSAGWPSLLLVQKPTNDATAVAECV